MPGPPPSRSSERRRRNKPKDVEPAASNVVALGGAAVVKAPAEDRAWHVLAKGWYRSLKQSGQAKYFEPSDWQAARFCAHVMTEHLNAGPLRAGMVQQIWSMMGDLLTTEADRRRVRVELSRTETGDPETDASVTVMHDYAKMLESHGIGQ